MGNWPLNPAQNEAVASFDADILVTAGAGTGKTRVLTQKYLRLLEERRAAVPEIVAITFTKKAALEMRARIQSGLRELLDQARPAEAEYWQQQLTWLETARITTFHSFCLALIREYPLEAGVGPVDQICGEAEEAIYLQQAGEAAFFALMREPGFPVATLTKILTDFGWEAILDDLSAAYRRIRETGIPFAAGIAQTANQLKAAIDNTPYRIDHLGDAVAELLAAYPALQLTDRARDILGALQNSWPSYRAALESEDILSEVLPALAAIRKALPRNLPKAVKERVEEIHAIAAALTQVLLDREALERLPVYGALLERVDRHYTLLKAERGALDFADQIILARNLLRNHPQVAAEVRGGIGYLLVDEFQDTNPLQMELIALLTNGMAGSVSGEGRLMAVGDIKQSIYRFRGADASIIHTVAESFRSGAGRVIALAENYRAADFLIHFINGVAAPLFAGEVFAYEPLVPSVADPNAGIELLWTGSADRRAEAEAIAGRIQELLLAQPSSDNALNYGDIVILFRASTAMNIYQQALQNAAIPFYTASGGRFFRCQEVLDQLNLLRLVEQGYDGVALFGLLTSPFVGLSYESLLWLGAGKNMAEGFYAGQWPEESVQRLSTAELERLNRFRRLILYLRRNRDLMRIPDILRTALQETCYRAILWTHADAAQSIANLEKLLAKAEEFCAQGFHDLASFLEYIKKLEEAEVLEGEAPTQSEAGNAVRLMTIHRAKGLEFRVVFLADLDRSFRFGNHAGLAFHQETGLGFPVKFGNQETGRPSNLERLRELERREEISELKRVLYVALTRAKQYLILVGSGKSRFKGNTLETAANWMKWFEILLDLHGAETAVAFQGMELPVRKGKGPDHPLDKPYRLLDEVLDAGLGDGLPGETPPPAEKQAAATLERARRLTIQLNVSELLRFKHCPRQYFWQDRLKLDKLSDPEAALHAGAPFGSMIGSFFHQAIRAATAARAREWPEELWRQTFSHLPDWQREKLKADLGVMWRNYQQSEFTVGNHPSWDETPFNLEIGSGIRVEGRWDRLMGHPDGRLHLVDFKTHRSGAAAEAAAAYHWQLQLYALAVQQVWRKLPERASLYFPFLNRTVDVPLDQASLETTVLEMRRIAEFVAGRDDWREYPMAADCDDCGYQLLCGTAAAPSGGVSSI